MEKQAKTIKGQGEKIKATEDYGKQMVESNVSIGRNDFNFVRDGVLFEKQKGIFNELLKGELSELTGVDDKINPNNLIYKFKNGKTVKYYRGIEIRKNYLKNLKEWWCKPKRRIKTSSNV